MNLIADIGNTTTKIAVVSDGKIVSKGRFGFTEMIGIAEFLSHYKCEKAIISSVKGMPEGFAETVGRFAEYVHILSRQSAIPFGIIYDTPETLGMDRVAAVAGAYNKYSSSDVLVIDAGTAITYDLLVNGKYEGGAISPGIEMRFKALNTFTGRLPLVEKNEKEISFPAKDTISGIRAGVINGVVFEINEYIRNFEKYHADNIVMITGGDSAYLCNLIGHKHIIEPDLVLLGLNNILEYNAYTKL